MRSNFILVFALSLNCLNGFAATEGTSTEVAAPGNTTEATHDGLLDDIRVTATDHILLSTEKDPTNPFGSTQNTFVHADTVQAEKGPYSAKIEISNRVPLDSTTSTSDPTINKPFNLEKATVEAEWSNLDVKLGDSYEELGKGIMLSLYRDDVFGIDNTLQGGALHWHPSGIDATFLAGRVNAVAAPLSVNPVPDPVIDRNVWMSGGQVKVEVAKDTKVGAQALYSVEQPFNSPGFDRSWKQYGLTFSKDGLFDSVDIYAESNMMTGQYVYGSDILPSIPGYGSYGSITWSPDRWKLKCEVKDYRNYDFDFQRPPTLEEDLVDESNLNNVSGSRLYAERKLADNTTSIHASTLVAYDRNFASVLYHGVVGSKFEAFGKTQFEVKAGYRWMPGHSNLAHASISSKIKTFKGQSIELSAMKQKSNEGINVIPILIDRNVFSVYYNFSERWAGGIGYENVPSNTPDLGNNFFNINASLKRGDLTGRVMIGQTSGGTVCSGGVCRVVPPYSGALVESIVTF